MSNWRKNNREAWLADNKCTACGGERDREGRECSSCRQKSRGRWARRVANGTQKKKPVALRLGRFSRLVIAAARAHVQTRSDDTLAQLEHAVRDYEAKLRTSRERLIS